MSKNIAISKKVLSDMDNVKKISNHEDLNLPETYWCANDGEAGHWLKVDLEDNFYLTEIQILWEKAHSYEYFLEISLDDINWIKVSGNDFYIANSQITNNPVNARARYVKVTIVGGVSRDLRASIFDFRVLAGTTPEFVNGADISQLEQIEDFGGKYYNRIGENQDCVEIIKDHGVNYIRLKVWNKPGLPNSDPAGYNDKAHVLKMSKRIKEHGFKLLIDFHYSDFWVDPGKQTIPEEWENLSFEELKKAMYDFTYDVLLSLKNQGTMPEMVQVGNEISSGMMWKVAKVSDKFDTEERWDKLCSLLKSGLSAVKDVDNSIQSIIHIEKGGDNEGCRYFYDKLVQHDVNFDIIGLSFYPIWHGTVTSFQNNILDFAARYQKGVIAVETAYPYTTESGDDQPNSTTFPFTKIPSDYPPSIQNQANMIQAIIFALKSVPNQKGLGYFYWQPDFIPVKGAGWKYGEGCEWDDQTMFDFSGHALWSLDIFKIHCSDADFRN